jgi:hypothetical protein
LWLSLELTAGEIQPRPCGNAQMLKYRAFLHFVSEIYATVRFIATSSLVFNISIVKHFKLRPVIALVNLTIA